MLAATTEPAEYAWNVEAMIGRHCQSEQAEMPVLARRIETSVQPSPAQELIAEVDGTIGPIVGVASPTDPSNSG